MEGVAEEVAVEKKGGLKKADAVLVSGERVKSALGTKEWRSPLQQGFVLRPSNCN